MVLMSGTARTITLGRPPSGWLLVCYLIVVGIPAVVMLVALASGTNSKVPVVIGVVSGLAPVGYFVVQGKKLDINSGDIPIDYLEAIDSARDAAGLRWLRVSYLRGHELPYPVMMGPTLTLSSLAVAEYSPEQLGWAVRSGAKKTIFESFYGLGFLWLLGAVIGCLAFFPAESTGSWVLILIGVVLMLGGSFLVAKHSELAADRWATQSSQDVEHARFVLGFALNRQLARDKSQRFMAIPPYELRTRAKSLGIPIE